LMAFGESGKPATAFTYPSVLKNRVSLAYTSRRQIS
jgi:hypothetical protein